MNPQTLNLYDCTYHIRATDRDWRNEIRQFVAAPDVDAIKTYLKKKEENQEFDICIYELVNAQVVGTVTITDPGLLETMLEEAAGNRILEENPRTKHAKRLGTNLPGILVLK